MYRQIKKIIWTKQINKIISSADEVAAIVSKMALRTLGRPPQNASISFMNFKGFDSFVLFLSRGPYEAWKQIKKQQIKKIIFRGLGPVEEKSSTTNYKRQLFS